MRAAIYGANGVGAPGASRYGFAVIATLLVGCGDDATRTFEPNVGSCASGWQTIFTQPDGLEPTALALAEDALLFRAFEGSVADFDDGRGFIKSLSLRDGLLRTLVEAEARLLWIESDTLLYSSGDTLSSIPLAGGVPELMLDARIDAAGIYGFPTGLDAEHLYWVNPLEASDRTFSIWRIPRAGGAAERFASLPDFESSTRVWLGPAGLLAADKGKSSLIPLDGSAAIPLAEVTSPLLDLLGFDELGTYWRSGSSDADAEIVRAPVTGAPPEPFWPHMPDGFSPWSLWPDGRGGWLVSGHETFDDGVEHYESWSLDSTEKGRLAACDPGVRIVGEVTDPVFAPDAAYQIIRQGDEPMTWSIVKVSLE